MCKLCGGVLHDPTPPKRPRRNRAVSAAARGGRPVGCVPHPCEYNCGLTATPDRKTSVRSAEIRSNFTPVGTLSGHTSRGVSNTSQIPLHSSTTTASADRASETAVCNASEEFTFSSPTSLRCSDPTTSPSTPLSSSTSRPILASSSGLTSTGQSELSRNNSDCGCSATTVYASQKPSSTCDNQFLPTSTAAKMPSAPVFASYTPTTDEEHTRSAPPSLFPLTNQPPVTSSSSSSSSRWCSSTYPTPSYTASIQFFGQSVTSGTSSHASAESQASGSTFSPPLFSSSPVGTSSDSVFLAPVATNNSACSTFASAQSHAVFEAQTSVGSTSSGSINSCRPLPGTSSSTSGSSTSSFVPIFGIQSSGSTTYAQSSVFSTLFSNTSRCGNGVTTSNSMDIDGPSSTCTTSSFVPVFGVQSSGTFTRGSSTQSFVFRTLSNNTFRCGNAVTTESSMDVGQPLGTPVARTTCWRWHENDTLSQASSTLAPSSRSSPFSQQTTSRENVGAIFLPASERRPDSCQPTIRTSSQAIAGVDVGGALPPTTLFQSSTWQQQNANDRQSQTSVSWARQHAVMSTTTSSQSASHDAPFHNSSPGIRIFSVVHKM